MTTIKSSSSTLAAACVTVFIICTLGQVLCHSLGARPFEVANGGEPMQTGVSQQHSVARHSAADSRVGSPIGDRPTPAEDARPRRHQQYDDTWLEHVVNDRPFLIVRKRSTDQGQRDDELIDKLLTLKNNYSIDKKNSYKLRDSDAELKKATLTNKLHKLIDSIMDEQDFAQQVAAQSKVGVPMQRTRLVGAGGKAARVGDDKLELGKRIANLGANDDADLSINVKPLSLGPADSNSLAVSSKELGEQPGEVKQAVTVSPAEHARRILNDGFGILKEATFTTNNHLGNKGVPKFGSDETF